MTCVPVNPDLLLWARERAGVTQENLAGKFKKLPLWEAGIEQPTLRQLEAFANVVHAPVGCLFLSEPPKEDMPIPDFRTFANHVISWPSPNLLDTIYACQERQNWYRDHVRIDGSSDLDFVGSSSVELSPETVAFQIRRTLHFELVTRRECST